MDEEINTEVGSGVDKIDGRKERLGGIAEIVNLGPKRFHVAASKFNLNPQQVSFMRIFNHHSGANNFEMSKVASFFKARNFHRSAHFRRILLRISEVIQVE